MTMRTTFFVTVLAAAFSLAAHAAEPGTGYEQEPPDTVACPAEPLLLNDFLSADGWRYEGTTESQDSHAEGTCGGGAGDVVHRFVAPSDGTATFRVRPRGLPADDTDPVLYLRSACGPEGVELACVDDGLDGSLSPEISLEMVAGQEVFVFVDGYLDDEVGAWRGPYTLDVGGEFVAGPVEGPFVHVCRCPDGREASICTDQPCENSDPCRDSACGGIGAGDGTVVSACFGGVTACESPDPPAGPGLMTCACFGSESTVLPVPNAFCDTVDDGPDADAPATCASWCTFYGLGGSVDRPRCARDHIAYTDTRRCPTNDEGGILYAPRVVCDARDAAALDCGNEAAWGSRDIGFYNLEGCGCGCADVGSGCPDQDDADVSYRSHDPDECTRLNFECPEGQTKFFKPYCGCGCAGPTEQLCADPESGSRGVPDPGIPFYYTGDWPACADQQNWVPCGPNETMFIYDNCGCGCYAGDAAAITLANPGDPTYTMVANGNYRAEAVDCPFNADPFANPLNGGCTYHTGECPEREVAARIVSDDWDTCRTNGVTCPEGEYPFIHPICGCGCLPDGVVATRADPGPP
jgi:hypothetical protein